MRPLDAPKPWRKTLRTEARGVPTGRRKRAVETQQPTEPRGGPTVIRVEF